MAIFGFVTPASVRIKRDSSHSVKELIQNPMTATILTSTLETVFSVEDALSWQHVSKMLPKLPPVLLLNLTLLAKDLDLVTVQVSRKKRYSSPLTFVCSSYSLVRNNEGLVTHIITINDFHIV